VGDLVPVVRKGQALTSAPESVSLNTLLATWTPEQPVPSGLEANLRAACVELERQLTPAPRPLVVVAVMKCLRPHLTHSIGEPPNPDDYAEALDDVPVHFLAPMAKRSLKTHKFMPKPAELRALIADELETLRHKRRRLGTMMMRARR
jgi:hypothetical protein